MTKSPKGWLQAKIPKKAVTGKSIQFYFEGRNGAGKPVVANGGADSPNIVLVVEEESTGEASKAAGRRRGREPARGERGEPAAAPPPRARRQGARGARHALRQAQVVDRDRHRHRLRLRQGERVRGGQQVASTTTQFHVAAEPVRPRARLGRNRPARAGDRLRVHPRHRALGGRAAAVHARRPRSTRSSPTRARSASWPSCSSTRSSRSFGSSSGRWRAAATSASSAIPTPAPHVSQGRRFSDFKDTIVAGPFLAGAAPASTTRPPSRRRSSSS